MTLVKRSALERFRNLLLATWTIAAMCSLALAWFVDEAFGYLAADSSGRARTTVGRLAELDMLTAPSVFVLVALSAALWFKARRRPNAASAAATAAVVVLAFGSRVLLTAHSIGWRSAFVTMFGAGRTIAATTITLVLVVAFHREGFLQRYSSWAIGLGLPALVGVNRLAGGIHSGTEIVEQLGIGLCGGIGVVVAYVLTDTPGRAAES